MTTLSPPHAPAQSDSRTVARIPVCRLSTAEALVVWGVRHWVQSMKAHLDPSDLLRRGFATIEAEAAAEALDHLLWITLREATAVRDVGCLRCPTLGDGELDILRAVALAQRGRKEAVHDMLLTWLPPSAARAAGEPVSIIARALTAAGMALPMRAGEHPEMWWAHGDADQGGGYRGEHARASAMVH